MEPSIEIVNTTGQEYLKTIPPNSVDLVLTDPPYIISRESGMNTHYNNVAKNKMAGVEFVKTEEEWIAYKTKHNIKEEDFNQSLAYYSQFPENYKELYSKVKDRLLEIELKLPDIDQEKNNQEVDLLERKPILKK